MYDDLDGYVRWPGVQQVLRRTCERVELTTGAVSQRVTYGLTSVPTRAATAAELEALWRGHWTIENRVHYVRDVTFGEDAHQMHTGQAPEVLAVIRSALMRLIRKAGWRNIAAALRHDHESLPAAFQLLSLSGR